VGHHLWMALGTYREEILRNKKKMKQGARAKARILDMKKKSRRVIIKGGKGERTRELVTVSVDGSTLQNSTIP